MSLQNVFPKVNRRLLTNATESFQERIVMAILRINKAVQRMIPISGITFL